MYKLTFSTGTFSKQKLTYKQMSDIIKRVAHLIDGVEVCCATTEELQELNGEEEGVVEFIETLTQFEHNTIHSPFKKDKQGTPYMINKYDRFDKFRDIYLLRRKIKAINVVFHLYNIRSIEVIKTFKGNYSIENTIGGFWHSEKFCEHGLKWGFPVTIDTSHAFQIGIEEYQKLLKCFMIGDIRQIHLSNIIEGEHHRSFKYDKQLLEYVFSKLRETKTCKQNQDVLITIEENFNTEKELIEEIQLVRKHIIEENKRINTLKQ